MSFKSAKKIFFLPETGLQKEMIKNSLKFSFFFTFQF